MDKWRAGLQEWSGQRGDSNALVALTTEPPLRQKGKSDGSCHSISPSNRRNEQKAKILGDSAQRVTNRTDNHLQGRGNWRDRYAVGAALQAGGFFRGSFSAPKRQRRELEMRAGLKPRRRVESRVSRKAEGGMEQRRVTEFCHPGSLPGNGRVVDLAWGIRPGPTPDDMSGSHAKKLRVWVTPLGTRSCRL